MTAMALDITQVNTNNIATQLRTGIRQSAASSSGFRFKILDSGLRQGFQVKIQISIGIKTSNLMFRIGLIQFSSLYSVVHFFPFIGRKFKHVGIIIPDSSLYLPGSI